MMDVTSPWSGFAYEAAILGVMVLVAALEAAIPLRALGRRGREHLTPNLVLTFITFATNIVWNSALVAALVWLESRGMGLLRQLAIGSSGEAVLAVVLLDFSFYVAHVAMHKVPLFWRFHRVHHCDPVVDVTTTIRQHPGEGVIRYGFLAVFACVLGVSPAGFAVYRACSAVNALFEHANIRLPRRIDRMLAWVTTWPNMHKVHHSRLPRQTDSNYGNILSCFDRLFGTFTPSTEGTNVRCGLEGFDDPATQKTAGLLMLPFAEIGSGRTTGDGVRSNFAVDLHQTHTPVREM
jgi:sterol desaturase/sphingolipid hydroxylase (fatty acid hydroxylase superfamily)